MYDCKTQTINGKKVAIIVDNNDGDITVTNNISNIAKRINIDYIIYQDTMGVWDFWSRGRGFGTLALNGEVTRDMDTAIAVAIQRYL